MADTFLVAGSVQYSRAFLKSISLCRFPCCIGTPVARERTGAADECRVNCPSPETCSFQNEIYNLPR